MKVGSHSFFLSIPLLLPALLPPRFTSFSPLFTSSSLFSPPSFASFSSMLSPSPCLVLSSLLGPILLVWSYPPCLVLSSLSEKGGCWDNKRKRSHKRFAHETLAEREGFALGPKGRFHKAERLKEHPPWGETPRT